VEDRWKSDTWLDQRIERLDALYQKFGRDGLKEFKDANLLLWWKQMELRDGRAEMTVEQKRLLELEIKDLAGYLKDRRPERKHGPATGHQSGRSRGEKTMADWNYRIAPYKRANDEFGWSPASEAEATVWFGFRKKGDDHRCFGVFPTRQDAERAIELMKAQDLKQQAEAPELKQTRGLRM
jgi:hypothetical protein